MKESLLSVGIDLGTTTTQMIVSRLYLENTASPFAVPRMEICDREILYQSEPYFTPLRSADTLDAPAIEQILRSEYEKAGISPSDVKTGAVIITGETARKENARQVLTALSDLAGSFVVATAGPALESVLAARGAGADCYAEEHGVHVLHFDIGGGTSNLALYGPEGELLDTGCLNVGGRLLKFDKNGTITYVSPVLQGCRVGEKATPESLAPLLETLVQALEEAAGLRPVTALLAHFITDKTVELPDAPLVFSFSGGVADLIGKEAVDWLRYGDLGVLLGAAIGRSRLCKDGYVLGQQTLRATVVGAGSYSTELSGSTVSCTGAEFPLQGLAAIRLRESEERADPEILSRAIQKKLELYGDAPVVLSMKGQHSPGYSEILRLAEGISMGLTTRPVVIALEQDMAKALGQALRCHMGKETPIVCLDGLHIPEGSFLDIAAPVMGGTAVPVVVKTLAFS
ncbi:MAG: ethanolamine ammonia-lyase reactivating factor EutA [Oscillospiraceae bacterium]|nr:ethanolamine ammonia-lyase reactivating factor EutA [Oscillospiraceae bacterium]